MADSSKTPNQSPSPSLFSPDFDAITKRIPSFGEEFNIPAFMQLVSRVEGFNGTTESEELPLAMAAMVSSDLKGTPKSDPTMVGEGSLSSSAPKFTKFAGLIPSPVLLREKRNKAAIRDGKKDGDTKLVGALTHDMAALCSTTDDAMQQSQDDDHRRVLGVQSNETPAIDDMVALKKLLESMQSSNASSSQCPDLEEFPILSRAALTGGSKSSKLPRSSMEASRGDESAKGTRKADFKESNNLDCHSIKANYEIPPNDTLTKTMKGKDSKCGDDWADLERDIHSKCGEMNDISGNNSVALNRTTPIHGNMTFSTAANAIPNHTPEPIIVGDIDIHAHTTEVKSNAFLESNRTSLRFIEPELIHGNVFVRPTWDMVQRGKLRWENTAVGYFLGKKLSFMGVKNYVNSIWKGLVEVKATSNGFYFFKFESNAHLLHVLEGGPWMFMGQPLFLERWKEGMTLEQKPHQEVPIWVKFKHLPTEYWTTEGLSTVASSIGKPLYPDVFTTTMERIEYARVCVLVNVTAKFPDHIYIMLPSENGEYNGTCKVGVEYEWRPIMCHKCQSFGHNTIECPLNKKLVQRPKPVQVYIPKPITDEGWQQQRKKGGATNPRSNHVEKPVISNHAKGEEKSQSTSNVHVEQGKRAALRTAESNRITMTKGTKANLNTFAILEQMEEEEMHVNEAKIMQMANNSGSSLPSHEDKPT